VFGISMWEIVLILVVALIVLGPRQLTEVAKTAGRIYRELQKMAWDVRNSIDLNSLDTSPPPSPPRYEPLLPKTEPTPPETSGIETPAPAKKSGPDFYADLLESSREVVEPDKPKGEVRPGETEADKGPSTKAEAEKPASDKSKT